MNSEPTDDQDDHLGIPLEDLPTADTPVAGLEPDREAGAWLPEGASADPPTEPGGQGVTAETQLPLPCEPPAGHPAPTPAEFDGPQDDGLAPKGASTTESIGDAETIACLRHIHARLDGLQREFEGKLKYDAQKDRLIDQLHQELQGYRQDFLKKHFLTVILDVIKVADDIRKWLHYFRALDPAQRDPLKLFRYLEAVPSDLEDVFCWHGVKPYSTADGHFDPTRHRSLKQIPTDEAAKDKTIARSLRPGYEWDGKVIRQEMVAVYLYEDASQPESTRNGNE